VVIVKASSRHFNKYDFTIFSYSWWTLKRNTCSFNRVIRVYHYNDIIIIICVQTTQVGGLMRSRVFLCNMFCVSITKSLSFLDIVGGTIFIFDIVFTENHTLLWRFFINGILYIYICNCSKVLVIHYF